MKRLTSSLFTFTWKWSLSVVFSRDRSSPRATQLDPSSVCVSSWPLTVWPSMSQTETAALSSVRVSLLGFSSSALSQTSASDTVAEMSASEEDGRLDSMDCVAESGSVSWKNCLFFQLRRFLVSCSFLAPFCCAACSTHRLFAEMWNTTAAIFWRQSYQNSWNHIA